jgi:hypothetical protein
MGSRETHDHMELPATEMVHVRTARENRIVHADVSVHDTLQGRFRILQVFRADSIPPYPTHDRICPKRKRIPRMKWISQPQSTVTSDTEYIQSVL